MPQLSLAKEAIKVVLLEGVHESAVNAFHADGYTRVVVHKGALGEEQLVETIRDAHVVGIRSRTQLTRGVLEQARSLIAVGCFCIGTNQVDVDAAETRGLPVFNAPFSNTRSVAELVLAEVIMLFRGIPARNAAAHRGRWMKSASGSHEVRGKTLGIVGYGRIGTQVSVLAEALGMQVIFHDIVAKLALGNARPAGSLDAVLEAADVVTLHVPETPETRGMIGAEQIAKMRPGAMLLNASRGTVVDIDALARAIESGHLGGAAIDVYPKEPGSNDDELDSPLRRFDNVILTPHIGGSTLEAQEAIGREVAEKLLRYSNDGSTLTAVNFPEVALPEHPGGGRLLHIHENRPGMLTQLNEVFSRQRVNIAAQYLRTTPRIGYVVMDLEGVARDQTLDIKKRLEDIPGTIRTRVLF